MSLLSPYGFYPIQQTFRADDENRHMVVAHLHPGYLQFRCGYERWAYYGTYGSCSWSTSDPPTCPGCIDWVRAYVRQPPLPFPNGYDEDGNWVHIPEITRPVPKWFEKLSETL